MLFIPKFFYELEYGSQLLRLKVIITPKGMDCWYTVARYDHGNMGPNQNFEKNVLRLKE